MFCRSIIFTKAPLMKAYRYKDVFQIVPIFYSSRAQLSVYAQHFPCFLEFKVDDSNESLDIEPELEKKGMSEETLRELRRLPSQTRVRKEILHLLSSLTNFQFFEYGDAENSWGVQTPMDNISQLTEQERRKLNNQTSHWNIRGYIYPGLREDLSITGFTLCKNYLEATGAPMSYFVDNPIIEKETEISFPPYLDFVLDGYFALRGYERNIVRQCIGLLYEGIDLFDTKRSVSLLSVVSSIEGMAKLDWQKYGDGTKLKIKERFVRYLKIYVAGKSEDKFRKYYKKRCDITHDGTLFLSDLDLYGSVKKQDEDWLMRLEVLQAARIAMYNWLRRKD